MPGFITTAAPPRAPESAWRRSAVWLLVTLAYLFAFPYYERLNNPNENARTWATRAIVEHGVLNIDAEEREWGYVNDKCKNDKHVYSGKAPGASFLGVPVLAVVTKIRHLQGRPSPGKMETTFWLRLFAVKVPLCVFFWFFARYVERLTGSRQARDVLLAALGLGTLMYPYGGLFVGHALAAAAACGAYMLLAPASGPGARRGGLDPRLVGAGLLAGATVVFEYQAAFVVAALTVYAVHRYRRESVAYFLGAAPMAVGLGAYHTAIFGRPWRFPFGNVENPEFLRRDHSAGFHGLALPKLPALGASLFAPDYGLFVFSPILAVGLLAALALLPRRPRRDAALVVAASALMFLFLAGMSNWRAGWCVGPRYITTVAPFLVLGVAFAWAVIQRRTWLMAPTLGLVIVSVFLNVVSGAVYPHYPEVFDNPVFDLTLPVLRAGYAPYSFGWLLGLRGLASVAPLALVVLGALGLGLAGEAPRPPRRWARISGALAVAALCLLALSAYGRKPSPGEQSSAAFVRATWEPQPAIKR
ncbi:MAG TPA: hypothetical protein VHK47_03200 [Polyangia bacterium]|jgi:hypothetical protein|nr:hypothetical protein [Polyangia bacterium]